MWRESLRASKMNVDKIIQSKEDMVKNIVQAQVQQIIAKLAQAMGVAPEELMAMLQGGKGVGGGGQKQLPAPGGMSNAKEKGFTE